MSAAPASPTVSRDVVCTPSATGRTYGAVALFGPVLVDVAAKTMEELAEKLGA